MAEYLEILIEKPFNDQYTLLIESDLNGVDVNIHSKVQLRYDFSVIAVGNAGLEVRLIQLDNVVMEANNPLVGEVAQVSQIFGRMYSELHLLLTQKGEVLKILNIELLLSKWRQTKAEMEKYIFGNDALKDAIILNDEIFNNPEKIKIAIQANEFIKIYFGQTFGQQSNSRFTIQGTNIFNTIALDWMIENKLNEQYSIGLTSGLVTINTMASPVKRLNSDFIKSAYSQFEGKLNLDNVKPELYQEERRLIETASGRIQQAAISKIEIVDEQRLFNKLKYNLNSEKVVSENIVSEQAGEEDQGTKSKFSFF